ncbi:MAG: GNAT family N-acetyltransferase [Haloquadratum sp.]|nr:GNAT family N-acetyltransferase [Haloferacaceae archaeon]MDR9445094.1 GNAT family N-acetyltransferase [Haloquadratum sp.]
MYVRDAKNRDEVWLLDQIEAAAIDDPAFRSRDYVIALDEETGQKVGFGRIRVHADGPEDHCELAFVYTLEEWRDHGVGAHIIERLIAEAGDAGYERVYTFTEQPEYFSSFGFDPLAEPALPAGLRERFGEVQAQRDAAAPMAIAVDGFKMPPSARRAFKQVDAVADDAVEVKETPEDFGYDPETTTHKYDVR